MQDIQPYQFDDIPQTDVHEFYLKMGYMMGTDKLMTDSLDHLDDVDAETYFQAAIGESECEDFDFVTNYHYYISLSSIFAHLFDYGICCTKNSGRTLFDCVGTEVELVGAKNKPSRGQL